MNKYVYEMIDELYSPDYVETFLFTRDVPSNNWANRKLHRNLNDLLRLGWLDRAIYGRYGNLEDPKIYKKWRKYHFDKIRLKLLN